MDNQEQTPRPDFTKVVMDFIRQMEEDLKKAEEQFLQEQMAFEVLPLTKFIQGNSLVCRN